MTADTATPATVETTSRIVFGSLTEQGMQTMTEGGVEFVLCVSALTAQM
ncbi:hypothetical protein EDF35_2301 [Rathayibacter sp. PhB151]|nr:hypothetical protein EDF35_2301 [Rathayibacter sp. PhB151]